MEIFKINSKNSSISFLARWHIVRLLTRALPPELKFHNFHHTLNVVRGVKDIGSHMQLTKEQMEIVELSAWFHDSGHIYTYDGHEKESQRLAKEFLEYFNYPANKTKEVLACIEATRMPQQPHNELQQVMCDADLYHLSMHSYPYWQHLLREEWRLVLGKRYSANAWMEENIAFLENHSYFTNHGKNVLEKRKRLNIERCKSLISENKNLGVILCA